SDGSFELKPLAAGSYRARVSATGFETQEINFSVTRGARTNQVITLVAK
ncbi:MAG: carboxypeptidase regulatory-like domain-containing protein, partial [Planctomycetes bacterium]|nr:carboxypeptidase regulatory-like domain-containing protein [Planctomycetota bacterium]